MKKFVLYYFLPFFCSLVTVFFLNQNRHVFINYQTIESDGAPADYNYIANFDGDRKLENDFLSCTDTSENIFVLGSSELTVESDARPFVFLNEKFNVKVKGVGHAGNQCFSMFMQLLANRERLKNAPIVLIISPGWFHSRSALGTSSEVFLEFNSEHFLEKSVRQKQDAFNTYANKRLSEMFNEFNSPGLALKIMNYRAQASKGIFHKMLFQPLIKVDELLLEERAGRKNDQTDELPVARKGIVPKKMEINWDSLFSYSTEVSKKACTNNNMGIEDHYYSEHINGEHGKIEVVDRSVNKELEDFKMLLLLLKANNANASFVIQPINPLYYDGTEKLSPLITEITSDIQKNGFPCLDLFEASPEKYNKAILKDIMHLDDLGWYKMDQFIVNTYHLSR